MYIIYTLFYIYKIYVYILFLLVFTISFFVFSNRYPLRPFLILYKNHDRIRKLKKYKF